MKQLCKILIDDNNIKLDNTDWVIQRNKKPTITNIMFIEEIVGDNVFIKDKNINTCYKIPIEKLIPVKVKLVYIHHNGIIDETNFINISNDILRAAWNNNQLNSEYIIYDNEKNIVVSNISIDDIYNILYNEPTIIRMLLHNCEYGATLVRNNILSLLLKLNTD